MTLTVGLITCAPFQGKNSIETVRYEFEHLPDGGYNYSYELSDGSYKNENAYHKKVGDQSILTISGDYGYKDADGKWYRVNYTSDENGFRASGEHLPDTGTDAEPPSVLVSPALIATLAG